eukprot:Gb_18026 [translate_table: standard]
MAVTLQSHEVSDLCLGKPALYWLPVSATVGDALKALKQCHETELGVWNCDHSLGRKANEGNELEDCKCVGKICMVDIICYLSRDESLFDPASALSAPISGLLPRIPSQVRHINGHSSLLQALDLILDGAQNLIVPIETPKRLISKKLSQKIGSTTAVSPTSHGGKEFCWITQEDVVRFLLGFIGVFSPLPSMTIEDLGILNTDVLMVEYDKPATSALHMIQQASRRQTAVAVIENEPMQGPKLIGEISTPTLMCCDETVALALATLSAGDFMAYVDCGGPPESLVELVRKRINQKMGFNHGEGEEGKPMSGSDPSSRVPDAQLGDPWEESSDEEFSPGSPTGPLGNSKKWSRSFKSNKFGYASRSCRAAPLTCRPWSSLVAVMVQALAHRVNYVWVTDEDSNLVGMVTFFDILDVFWNHLQTLD